LQIDAGRSGGSARKVPLWTSWLAAGLFGLALIWLYHVVGHYRWQDIVACVRAIPRPALLRAALFVTAGYACLTVYEALGLRYCGARLPYWRAAVVSFVAYGVGHSFGTNTFSGGAIRYRAYSLWGLNAKQVATVVGFGTLTFGLGAAVLLGASLLTQARLSQTILHLPGWLVTAAGVVLLCVPAAYLVFVCAKRGPLSVRGMPFTLPAPGIALSQILVSCAELMCAAAALFVLLPPGAHLGFLSFAGIYLVGIAAGVLSTVPGGVGVFESVLFLLLPDLPQDRLLGSMLVFRAIYYWVPFMIALAILGWHELWMHLAGALRRRRDTGLGR
jgi:uncharacterized membrane protein YbhN (UPF0104 family)